jgi:hypothetical protein
VFIYAKPTDMRKGFDGLYGLVLNEMELDPYPPDQLHLAYHQKPPDLRVQKSAQ